MSNFTIITEKLNNFSLGINPAAPAAAPVVASAPQQPKQPSIYGPVPQIPTMDAVQGIKFDFNEGIRILFPHNGKEYHVTFTDIDTGIILYSADTVPGAYVTSVKKFYIRFRLIIHEKGGKEPIFTYDLLLAETPDVTLSAEARLQSDLRYDSVDRRNREKAVS